MVLNRGRHGRLGELFPRLETFASGLRHTTDLRAALALQLGDGLFHGTDEPNDGKRFLPHRRLDHRTVAVEGIFCEQGAQAVGELQLVCRQPLARRLYAVPGDHRSAILDDDVVPLKQRIAIVELHRLGITR